MLSVTEIDRLVEGDRVRVRIPNTETGFYEFPVGTVTGRTEAGVTVRLWNGFNVVSNDLWPVPTSVYMASDRRIG